MQLWLYRLLLTLLFPLILYSGWKRCRKAQSKSQQNSDEVPIPHCFASRLGRNPTYFQKGGIWIHAVSVGETRSIFPLLKQLHLRYPQLPITLTSGSTQGAQQALRFSPVAIQHQMIPYDTRSAVNRFLNQIQPKLVIMIETEIWPNLYQACSERKIPLILANARIKQQSFKAYQKWGGQLVKRALNQTHLIASQFQADTDHLLALGADPKRIKQLGNLKFDIEIPANLTQNAQAWRMDNGLEDRFIWVAASTHADEEVLMVKAHEKLLHHCANALLILAPRHSDRFQEVAELLEQKTDLLSAIRSQQMPVTANTQVYLADTIGELMHWFACSDVAFIGGSLVPFGGHNILEPAALAKPILSGPYHMNLQALYDTFKQTDSITITQNTDELAETLIKLSQSNELQQQQGQKAYQCFQQQTGALSKLLSEIDQLSLTDPNHL
ncbi:3-deoxy-D-manno-octulosonic acid transferase [Hydrogenovibrio sp. SC-1]|uniref:3-deoxy-D-manno-octulosonic acid transferase n=1 Tax=Hydrogenovibrio sp. SC-1 TaxID=2065820 RepID=UPI000C7D4815|nr:3-deoxy-D-manno-octulosonic acid transferase [Hydrogenovibrio sp. SC-1]PLA75430.1 3-deoxy-D-manno-octulosonic acid transferase [Hydrogenovibrio sp. SC-1]